MIIKILGTGCKKCKELEANAKAAIRDLPGDFSIEKVTDINEIMNFGVMMTPGLVIDNVVRSTGKVLSAADIRTMIAK
ncbi:MAG: TM0996/MTH895 family glutaredoxin-like protein [Candidatus Cloacimonetes bacterium]|nr:TM0996/MTH895 family glutaredoxin-like protein [Candidatus Cloacimonadota bacterium]